MTPRPFASCLVLVCLSLGALAAPADALSKPARLQPRQAEVRSVEPQPDASPADKTAAIDADRVTLAQAADSYNVDVAFVDAPCITDRGYSGWRVFDLPALGIDDFFTVRSVSVGIFSAHPGGGAFSNLTVNLYASTGAPFPAGTRTLVGTSTTDFVPEEPAAFFVPMTAIIPKGASLAVEVAVPNTAQSGGQFLLGANLGPETAPSFVSSPACGLPDPVALGTLGETPRSFVLTVYGSQGLLTQSMYDESGIYPFGCQAGCSVWRVYDLPALGIDDPLTVTKVEVSILVVNVGTRTTVPLTVNLYSQTDAPFPGGTLIPVGSNTVDVGNIFLRNAAVPVTGTIPRGASLVVEARAPDGTATASSILFGANDDYGLAPTYASSIACSPFSIIPVPMGFIDVPVFVTASTTSLSQHTDAPIAFRFGCADENGTTRDASVWRAFDLPALGVDDVFTVTSVDVGVAFADARGDKTLQSMTVNVFANTGARFPNGTLTLVGSNTVGVPDQEGTVLRVPVSASIPVGASLVVEAHAPDGQPSGNRLSFGGNSNPQTGPTYVSSTACGIPTPTLSNSSLVLTVNTFPLPDDTVGLYATSTNAAFLRNLASSGPADTVFTFGGAPAMALTGDWDGDGADSLGLYVPATGAFFLRNANSPGPADAIFVFGGAGAGLVPISGDWNGDGVDTVGLYDPATGAFFLKNTNESGPADVVFAFGAGGTGLRPIVGDWNADGVDTVGLYALATGAFFLKDANSGGAADLVFTFGAGGFLPLSGDWNGDGRDTVGLYDSASGAFFLRNANAPGPADLVFTFGAGGPGLQPLSGDWDGS